MDKISVNAIGVTLRVTCTEDGAAVDLSSALAVEMVLTDPDGNAATKTATLTSDGTDGQFEYVTLAGDIDQVGIWSYRAKVTLTATSIHYGAVPTQFEAVS